MDVFGGKFYVISGLVYDGVVVIGVFVVEGCSNVLIIDVLI